MLNEITVVMFVTKICSPIKSYQLWRSRCVSFCDSVAGQAMDFSIQVSYVCSQKSGPGPRWHVHGARHSKAILEQQHDSCFNTYHQICLIVGLPTNFFANTFSSRLAYTPFIIHIYTVSQQNWTATIIWHNFTNSQHLLIIFGRERDIIQFLIKYGKVFKLAWNQLRGFHNNSSELTHPNSKFLGWHRTTYAGASTNGGGVGRRISHDFKNGGGCHERITLNHHFVRRPLLRLLGLFTSVYAPTSIPPTVYLSPTLW